MSVRRNPLYVFKNGSAIGIYEVPLESVVQIVDIDGAGTPLMTQLVSKALLTNGSTIDQYLSTPTAYVELDRYAEELNDLKDVELPSVIADEDILAFDFASKKWINKTAGDVADHISLGDLQDITSPTLANDGQLLEWDETNRQWNYVNSIKMINDLGDVNNGTAAIPAGKILTNDGTNWVPADIDGGSYQNICLNKRLIKKAKAKKRKRYEKKSRIRI